MKDQSSGGQADRISAEIAALASLGIRDLKSRWRAWYGTEPPARISRELLTSAIAYRLQEREFGGLAPATRRLLEGVAADRSSRRLVARARKVAPGALLVREWRGAAHQVTVHDDGVAYGLGFAMTLGQVETGALGGGDYYWGGAASTIFWLDPKEDMLVVFMTQLMPSATFNFRGQLRNIIYSAIVD
jgi:CubicO group peptidase (beta-lactamase class C family)